MNRPPTRVNQPDRKGFDMTDQRTKGTISKAQGKVEEAIGKVTGDREEEAKGKIRQVQGDAQHGVADVGDAIRNRRDPSR